MIDRIGIIVQDANSLGFLKGLKRRLQCNAEFVPGPAVIGRSSNLTRHQALVAWRYFKNKAVDLIVRFTDSDDARWQDVLRNEIEMFPAEARSILICGVAVDNTEHWLALNIPHIAATLRLDARALADRGQLTDRIKAGIAALPAPGVEASERVARIVAGSPPAVFKQWLEDRSLHVFYQACRAAASRGQCETPNEL